MKSVLRGIPLLALCILTAAAEPDTVGTRLLRSPTVSATQIAFGAMMLLVALRHRPLVPATLALVLLERSLHALNGWLLKSGSGHHPPEHYAVLIVVPLLGLALAASLRTRPFA